jgi:hypothetical protein
LHRQFHLEAAKLLELAVAGKKDAAKQAMGTSGEFSKVCGSLTMALMQWSRGTS